jgi:glycosyltransferase involved in cell wall biosynthesis
MAGLVPLINQVWPENTIPLVSISCITFNQESYIRETIEGFLLQETTFPVEILIHDDASTDATAEIIREYVDMFPSLFKPILRSENQYSQVGFLFAFLELDRAKGEFIALCEGDDFWTDRLKLEKQVRRLSSDKHSSFCFHSVYYKDEGKIAAIKLHKPPYVPLDSCFSTTDLINLDSQMISNCSVVFRSHLIKSLPNWVTEAPIGDLPLCLYLSTNGSIAYLDEPMAVYRVSSVGSWTSDMARNRRRKLVHLKGLKRMWEEFDAWTIFQYKDTVRKRRLIIQKAILAHYMYDMPLIRMLLNCKRKLFVK